MTTATDIANLALDVLKEARISSIEDARPIAQWLKRNFYVTRDALLEEAEWNFALKRVSLPSMVDVPAFGWDKQYLLPGDCIRVLPLTCDGTLEGAPISYEVEGGRILTDAIAPLKVRYVYRNENFSAYPATFVQALSGKLAVRMAHWLTGKSSFVQIAEGIYRDAMSKAWLADACQGSQPRPVSDAWVSAR